MPWHVLSTLADPTVPISKAGSFVNQVWVTYGITAVGCLIVAWLVVKAYRMLKREPLILALVIIIILAMFGAITIGSK